MADPHALGAAGRARIADRVRALPWTQIESALDAQGYATTGALLDVDECAALVRSYSRPTGFRSRIVMDRYGFGRGEYRYFDYPLPALVAELRTNLYAALAPIANRWMEALGREQRYPSTHAGYVERCHASGQTKATPLILCYGPGDYNCLHQDVYGGELFPLQATFLLAEPGLDFHGGELCLTTSRPRRQSRVDVVPLMRGEGALFAVRDRPEAGVRGPRRVGVRHGVSVLRAGSRHTLGIIFHDAE